jgi:hypothetical protein
MTTCKYWFKLIRGKRTTSNSSRTKCPRVMVESPQLTSHLSLTSTSHVRPVTNRLLFPTISGSLLPPLLSSPRIEPSTRIILVTKDTLTTACNMKLLNITFALVGLIATALASAVPRAALPRCTESNNETTTCGSRYSYGNDVFRCADLRWEWVERCSDPDFPCDNGACVAKQPECVEGEKECLTVLNHGHDGINICKNGE